MPGKLLSGHTWEDLDESEVADLNERYRIYTEGGIKVQPGNFFFPKSYLTYADRFYNFEVRDTDIFVVTFPKSGTNWIQEIVWNLVHNPNLDNPDSDISIDIRCPFMELDYFFLVKGSPSFDESGPIIKTFNRLCPGKNWRDGVLYNIAEHSPDPRLLKHHIPYTFLNPAMLKKGKMICLARDPRDVIASGFHYLRHHALTTEKMTIEHYVQDLMDGKIYGTYWEHMRLNWSRRNDPNYLFLFYEDLKADPKGNIKKIDQFIGTNRNDKQLDNIVKCTSFSYMKEKTKHNPPTSFDNVFLKTESADKSVTFFRKGKAGSWKEDIPEHLHGKINSWIKENLKDFGDDFKYKSLEKEL
ncbi:UNVERIFIED_CONTAM: hypothetical protein RMT77_009610 [Armadillidium vulgare]